ncbi:hypothetical protein [Sphingosinicella soli]|uniref:Uncharacterized protein n=1 Tax=Sphingosinicella soli TaxID=333708 RepID=A0A7W7B1Z4_9SPHN|nr:hypothetical protein [Sphingosinicella soli]MBB4631608.1 hypothetical protein [Sphingosinicella soli]
MPLNMLPQGFEELEPFQAYWGAPDTQTRRERREAATMDEIMAFYDVVLPLAPAAMKHLEDVSLDAMPPAEARLFELVLALAHVSMAVELHGAPRAPHTPYPHGVKLMNGPAHFG